MKVQSGNFLGSGTGLLACIRGVVKGSPAFNMLTWTVDWGRHRFKPLFRIRQNRLMSILAASLSPHVHFQKKILKTLHSILFSFQIRTKACFEMLTFFVEQKSPFFFLFFSPARPTDLLPAILECLSSRSQKRLQF